MVSLISNSVNDTIRIGRRLSAFFKPADILCLFGEFGSGKTMLTKGIASGLGIDPAQVISPSFVILRQYCAARLPLFHFDLYRMKDSGNICDLGYEEYLYDAGLSVIEWPERLKFLLPKEFLRINLSLTADNRRRIDMLAQGNRYKELLKEFKA